MYIAYIKNRKSIVSAQFEFQKHVNVIEMDNIISEKLSQIENRLNIHCILILSRKA